MDEVNRRQGLCTLGTWKGLKDEQVDLELYIEELGSLLIVAELDAPTKAKELLVLQAEDAKGFGE